MIQTAPAVGDAQWGRAGALWPGAKLPTGQGGTGDQNRILVYVQNRTCLGWHNTPHIVDITT